MHTAHCAQRLMHDYSVRCIVLMMRNFCSNEPFLAFHFPSSQLAHPGFELRLSEKLDEDEWPSLDGEKAPEPEHTQTRPGLRLSWTPDLSPAAGKNKSVKVDMRGRVCIEDPRALADASALAVSNRLARGCCKDGDWEKVLTDERRVHWLQQVSRRRALDKFGTPSEVTRMSAGCTCPSAFLAHSFSAQEAIVCLLIQCLSLGARRSCYTMRSST